MEYVGNNIGIFSYFIKILGINLGFTFCYYKIVAQKLNGFKITFVLLFNLLSTILQCFFVNSVSRFIIIIFMIFIHSLIYCKLFKLEIYKSLSTSVLSLSITYVFSQLASILAAMLYAFFYDFKFIDFAGTMLMTLITIGLIHLLFKAKRLKNVFSFLNNELINMFVLLLTIVFIFTYSIASHYSNKYLFITSFVSLIIFCILIKQAFVVYQNQRNQLKTIKDLEDELKKCKQKLEISLAEKDKIIKSNHEFYHRQEALQNKLNILAKSAFNTEIADELTNITNRIDNLSKEYSNKLNNATLISQTGITEINDMLLYMHNECINNNINFEFKLNCNIHKLIEKYISTSDLETLLGDLIRNAIIAINHNNSENKNILVIIGLKDNCYEIDIYDNGINFEINTLLNLGINKCSTHLNEGGTGIGLITTFETLNKSNGSFIVEEFNSGKYTKMLGIRFDSLNNYTINSYRANLIKQKNNGKRQIVLINK